MSYLRLSVAGLALFGICTVGCSPGTFFPGSTGPVTTGDPLPYHAFGDSITYGYGLVHPSTQAYPAVFAQAKALSLTNRAISGDQSCDVPARQIFPNAEGVDGTPSMVYSLLISSNDVDTHGAGLYEAVFNLCHQASIAWLALPAQQKLAATNATALGATHRETANGWNAVFTDAPGATLLFSFSRAQQGAVYLWYRITDGSTGAFLVSLDGAPTAPVSSSTTVPMRTQNGTTSSLALLRIPAVAPGQHSLVLKQTSTGASGMGIVAVGLAPGLSAGEPPIGWPRLFVGTTPPQNKELLSPCSPDPAPCLAFSADITANAALFAGDGLDVELFDPGKYMSATFADLLDIGHPNPLGDAEIAHALEDLY